MRDKHSKVRAHVSRVDFDSPRDATSTQGWLGVIAESRRRRRAKAVPIGQWAIAVRLAKILAATVTTLSLWLIWLGYGYDLAYLAEFGLSPEQLDRSASDFLLRSYRPLLAMAESLMKFNAWDSQQRILVGLVWPAALMALVTSALLALSAYAYSLRRRGSTYQERWVMTRVSALWSSNMLLAVRDLVAPVMRPARALRSVWVDKSTRWVFLTRVVGFAGGLAIGGALFVTMYVVILAAAFVLGVAITAVSGWPLTATQAGQKSAREGVIDPAKCAAARSYDGPHCVRVVINGCEVARGRLVDRGAQRIFLFMKAQNSPADFPMAKTIVEAVYDESPPSRGVPCGSE